MLHEIEPSIFDIGMQFVEPLSDDTALCFCASTAGGNLDCVFADREPDGSLRYPTCGEVGEDARFTYLFTIDERRFFLARAIKPDTAPAVPKRFEALRVGSLLPEQPNSLAFAAATGLHLATWYRDNEFCGRCAMRLLPSETERALACPTCGATFYPRISPAVIVAVTDGDRLLLTKYAHGTYRKHALVAGFVEIGETPEQAVHREVLEECGVRVKNIRYFGSQPWGLTGALMLGFFAELDGNDTVSLNDGELSWAGWIARADIEDDYDYALGRAMINAFLAR